MRYMLLLKYDEAAAQSTPPDPKMFEEMGRYNTALVDAGVLLAGEGLTPSKEGVMLTFDEGDEPTVTDGPFTEAKELVAGFWMLEVASREEAVQWARRCPIGPGVTLQVRRIPEMAEFEGVAPAELLDAETTLRQRIAERQQA
jgi:hypothetical protein